MNTASAKPPGAEAIVATISQARRPGLRGPAGSAQASPRAFYAIVALFFAASAAMTIDSCHSMAAMGAMEMPGGWMMSMAWMRMPDQSWLNAAASFLLMWTVMMTAMMLPSVAPALQHYRETVIDAGKTRLALLTVLVGFGYFAVWALFGLVAFAVGEPLASFTMEQSSLARAVPIACAAVVAIAGGIQFTNWKARRLACCRESRGKDGSAPRNAPAAIRHGIALGMQCLACCANLTAVLMVMGLMDIRAMILVSAAITAERLAPGPERIARWLGVVVLCAGLVAITRQIGAA
jgi:predicted metal-binding membrane protein